MKYKLQNGQLSFRCPGCKHIHTIPVDGSRGWSFDEKTITLAPSLLQTSGHYVTGQPQPPNCYLCNRTKEEDTYNYVCGRCHLFLRDGQLQFLNDCTHELADKTVPMIEYDQ